MRKVLFPDSILLWIGLPAAAAGLLLRFSALGERVLTPVEASHAWPAWAAANGVHSGTTCSQFSAASPLLDNLLWLIFQCLGASDTLTRCSPAVMGSLLVVLPWLLRNWLGNCGAIVAMVLFALDPWQLAFSRLADGTIFSAFLALAALVCVERLGGAFRNERLHRSSTCKEWVALAVLSALFLASGREFWSFAPAVGIYAILTVDWKVASSSRAGGIFAPACFSKAMGAFFATLFLAASFFGARWERLADLGYGLTVWLRSWNTAGIHVYSWNWALDRSLGEQAFTIGAGLAGLCVLWRGMGEPDPARARRRASALLLWAVWGLMLAIPGGRGPAGLLVMDLAMKLAAAFALGRLIERIQGKRRLQSRLQFFGLIIALIAAGSLWIQLYRRSHAVSDLETHLYFLLVILAMIASFSLRRPRLKPEWVLVLGAVLFSTWLNGGWRLSRQIDAGSVFFDTVGHPDLRLLEEDAQQWISFFLERHQQLQIRQYGDLPGGCLTSWYLRDIYRVAPSPDRENAIRHTIFITREAAAARPPEESPSPARYRVIIRHPSALEAQTSGPESQGNLHKQYLSEAVLLWLSTK